MLRIALDHAVRDHRLISVVRESVRQRLQRFVARPTRERACAVLWIGPLLDPRATYRGLDHTGLTELGDELGHHRAHHPAEDRRRIGREANVDEPPVDELDDRIAIAELRPRRVDGRQEIATERRDPRAIDLREARHQHRRPRLLAMRTNDELRVQIEITRQRRRRIGNRGE